MPILPPSSGLLPGGTSGGGVPTSSQAIYVSTTVDLAPYLSGDTYTIPDEMTVFILEDITLLTGRFIEFGVGCTLEGVSDLSTDLVGSTINDPLLKNLGNFEASRITLTQNGTADLFLQNAGGSVVEFFDVNQNGRLRLTTGQLFQASFGNATSTEDSVITVDGEFDFIVLADAQLLWPQIENCRVIEFTHQAIVERCTLDTATPLLRNLSAGFADVPGSVGIYVHGDASIEIFSQLNAGFRPLSTDSRHIVVQDPDAVAFGLLDGNSFSSDPTGTLYGCEPISQVNHDFIGQAGVCTSLTYDGEDLVAVIGSAPFNVLAKYDGVDVTGAFTTLNATTPANIEGIIDISAWQGHFFTIISNFIFRTEFFTTFNAHLWSLSEVKDTVGATAFTKFTGITTDGVNIYIAGQEDGSGEYVIYKYPPEFGNLSDDDAPDAIERISISDITTVGDTTLDYDGVNLVVGTNPTIEDLVPDPLDATQWTSDVDDAEVEQNGGEVNLVNGSGPGFRLATIPLTSLEIGQQYEISFDFVYLGTAIEMLASNDAVTLDSHTTPDENENFSLTFIPTDNTTKLVWINQVTTAALESNISSIIAEDVTGKITVLKGTTSEIQYSFPMQNSDPDGIFKPQGVVVLTEYTNIGTADLIDIGFANVSPSTVVTNSLNLSTTSLSMGHLSPTWEVMNSIGDSIVESSARGGCTFSSDGANIDLDINFPENGIFQAIDIGNAGVKYTPFSAREKCYLVDPINGIVKWLNVREKSQVITGSFTINPSASPTLTLAIVINDTIQHDSITTLEFENPTFTQTMNTLPISRDLKEGDLISLQVMSPINTVISILHVGLSIA